MKSARFHRLAPLNAVDFMKSNQSDFMPNEPRTDGPIFNYLSAPNYRIFQSSTYAIYRDLISKITIYSCNLGRCCCFSRDTMVKVWSLTDCTEVKSFGGHTGTVTSVLLLTCNQSASICKLKNM